MVQYLLLLHAHIICVMYMYHVYDASYTTYIHVVHMNVYTIIIRYYMYEVHCVPHVPPCVPQQYCSSLLLLCLFPIFHYKWCLSMENTGMIIVLIVMWASQSYMLILRLHEVPQGNPGGYCYMYS